MRLLSYVRGDEKRLAVVSGDFAIDLNDVDPSIPSDFRMALLQRQDLREAAQKHLGSAERQELNKLQLAPVVPFADKVICLGLNYFDHAKEANRPRPDYPWFFLRTSGSLLAHGAAALRPKASPHLDYEAELAVVIGRRGKHIPRGDALNFVFGYTCFNDFSVRDYQKRTPQWTIGKNFDATGAFGPWLVTADELPAGAAGLKIEGRLNGDVVQSASTSAMIFNVAETIELVTECLTLEPGDVLVMGTPAGVGQSRNPPVWLKHGDRFEVSIEGIGTLANSVEDEH